MASRTTHTAQKHARHPIGVAAERTGLTPDVLRAWERRYAAVAPSRAEDGQRLYSDADIERLRLMHVTTRSGRSIGKVAHLSTDALSRLAAEDEAGRVRDVAPTVDARLHDVIDAALALTQALDSRALADALHRAVAVMGVLPFVENVVAPLMRRIGDEWHEGRLGVAQEHLATSVVHDLLLEIMRGFAPAPGAARVLVATPSGDRHAIGAAIFAVVAAANGLRVDYLGADLPARDIVSAAGAVSARVVALSIVYADDRARVMRELTTIRHGLPDGVIVAVGGAGARALGPAISAIGIRVLSSVAELNEQLR